MTLQGSLVVHDFNKVPTSEFPRVGWQGICSFDPADYHSLNLTWFNQHDSGDAAEIFWAIHYSGHDKFMFTPLWFPISRGDFLTRDRLRRLWRNDPFLGALPRS